MVQLTRHISPEFNHVHDSPPPPYNNNFVGPPSYTNAAGPPSYSNIAMHQTLATTGPDGTHPTTVLAPGVVEESRPHYNQGML